MKYYQQVRISFDFWVLFCGGGGGGGGKASLVKGYKESRIIV